MTSTRPTPGIGFKRHYTPYVVDGEAVYLVSERGVSVVNGALAERLAPLLDGPRSGLQNGAELAPAIPADRVTTALDRLVAGGWAAASDPATDPAAAGFF